MYKPTFVPGESRTREKDLQRSRVYAAENVLDRIDDAGVRGQLSSLGHCQQLYGQWLAHAWFIERFGDMRIELHDGGGMVRATSYGLRTDMTAVGSGRRVGKIALPLWARKPWVMAHELAHLCVDARNWGRSRADAMADHYYVAGHGWQFCEVYLELVGHYCGQLAETALRNEFKLQRVRYKPKRVLTDAQKAALTKLQEAGRAHAFGKKKS